MKVIIEEYFKELLSNSFLCKFYSSPFEITLFFSVQVDSDTLRTMGKIDLNEKLGVLCHGSHPHYDELVRKEKNFSRRQRNYAQICVAMSRSSKQIHDPTLRIVCRHKMTGLNSHFVEV